MKRKIISIGFVAILLLSSLIVSGSSVKINNKSEIDGQLIFSADWTLMIYLDGDNDLEYHAIDDFLEMSNVGSDENVNIIVQLDRSPYYDSRYGDWTSCKRYRVTDGMVPNAASAIQDIGEANMGDPQTIIDFANWAMSNYPASSEPVRELFPDFLAK